MPILWDDHRIDRQRRLRELQPPQIDWWNTLAVFLAVLLALAFIWKEARP